MRAFQCFQWALHFHLSVFLNSVRPNSTAQNDDVFLFRCQTYRIFNTRAEERKKKTILCHLFLVHTLVRNFRVPIVFCGGQCVSVCANAKRNEKRNNILKKSNAVWSIGWAHRFGWRSIRYFSKVCKNLFIFINNFWIMFWLSVGLWC